MENFWSFLVGQREYIAILIQLSKAPPLNISRKYKYEFTRVPR